MKKGILIKYGEIVLKKKNRVQFENRLIKDIKVALRDQGTVNISKEQGRFFLEAPDDVLSTEEWVEETVEILTRVFGIIGICPVDVYTEFDMDTICQGMIEYVKREFDRPYTFKVFAKRTDKTYPLDSMAIAARIGEAMLDVLPGWKVDVHEPELKLYAELRSRVYIYGKEIPGLGGLPVGTGGKATLLLSGGIDSPVAGWMMAKRGVQLSAVYFHAHPYTSDRARDKVLELARRVSAYAGPICVYVVPFTEIQLDIYEKCQHEKMTIIMRRMMMRIAEKIAEKEKAQALITGESLGQVASQTLASLNCTNAVCKLPVFRPVIAFDKQDIIEIAKKIDTFETSILPYEDCCTIFVAKHPTTQPRLEAIVESEKPLVNIEEQIDRAVRDSEMYLVRDSGWKKIWTEKDRAEAAKLTDADNEGELIEE